MLKYEIHEADSSKGYNFPFILVYPEQLPDHVKIFVEGNNSVEYEKKDGSVQTFEEQRYDAIEFAKKVCEYADGRDFTVGYMYQQMNQPLVIPIIERCDAEHPEEYYTQMLGRNVVLDKTSKFANLSQQVVAMVEEAKKVCVSKKQDIKIDKKSGLCGFSASGVFASRMLFAEPESFDACLSMCSNAVQPLPVAELDGIELPYPLGTADYEQIFGKPFNLEEYKKARQMFFVGAQEDNVAYDITKKLRLHDQATQDKFIEVYGDIGIQARQRKIAKILQSLGMDETQSLVVEGDHNMGGKSKYITSFGKAIRMSPEERKKYVESEIRFAQGVRPALEPLKTSLAGDVSAPVASYGAMKEHFDSNLTDIQWIIEEFVKSIPNAEYRQRFMEHLNGQNKNVVVRFLTDPQTEDYRLGARTGRIKQKYKQIGKVRIPIPTKNVGKTEVVIPIGKEIKGTNKFITCFEQIGTSIHEIAHSLSQKHCDKNYIPPQVDEAQEIEAMFIENLFYKFLADNADRISQEMMKRGYGNLTPEFFEGLKLDYDQDHIKGLKENIAKVSNDNPNNINFNDNKAYIYRYVIGETYSYALYEKYLQDPVGTMQIFNEFIKGNASIQGIDAIAEHLFPNIDTIKQQRQQDGKTPLTSHEIVTRHISKTMPTMIASVQTGVTI